MAWRPNEYLIEGQLDNTTPNKVTGWLKFAGLETIVELDLAGNFHRDIRGAKVRLTGDGLSANQIEAAKYLETFSTKQTGKAGDMTAGLEPKDYSSYPYFEIYSDQNGRIVLELEPDQVQLLTKPIPYSESDPIDRRQQNENMAQFLCGLADAMGIPTENAISSGNTIAVEKSKKVIANDKIRGAKLLTKALREQIPPLYSQDGKGGKAIAYAKFFVGSWTWWVTEFDGNDTFFGLVEGFEKELGYFNLSQLEELNGPLGLPVERDLWFKPTLLEKIAPELFKH